MMITWEKIVFSVILYCHEVCLIELVFRVSGQLLLLLCGVRYGIMAMMDIVRCMDNGCIFLFALSLGFIEINMVIQHMLMCIFLERCHWQYKVTLIPFNGSVAVSWNKNIWQSFSLGFCRKFWTGIGITLLMNAFIDSTYIKPIQIIFSYERNEIKIVYIMAS